MFISAPPIIRAAVRSATRIQLTSDKRTSGETVKFHLSGKCVNGLEQSATYANYWRTRATNGGGGTRSAGAVQHHAVPKVHRATI